MPPFTFVCSTCGERHEELPAFIFDEPAQLGTLSEAERASRVRRFVDRLVLDDTHQFALGLLAVPIQGSQSPLVWGVWVSLSAASFAEYSASFDDCERESGMSYFGWLCNSIPGFPETQLLKVRLHVQLHPERPLIELEPTAHPLSVAQRSGLGWREAEDLAKRTLHPESAY